MIQPPRRGVEAKLVAHADVPAHEAEGWRRSECYYDADHELFHRDSRGKVLIVREVRETPA